eukprot:scaffold8732_cov87-Cylindrotheca_fusiformis.AAC.5
MFNSGMTESGVCGTMALLASPQKLQDVPPAASVRDAEEATIDRTMICVDFLIVEQKKESANAETVGMDVSSKSSIISMTNTTNSSSSIPHASACSDGTTITATSNTTKKEEEEKKAKTTSPHLLMNKNHDDKVHNKKKRKLGRTLTPYEVYHSLQEAKARGLPDGWTVTYDNRQKRKLWISPYNGKACKSIPEALAASGVKGFTKTQLTETEKANAMKRAKAKGLPDGWDVSWDPRRRRTIWIAPDGETCCDSVPEALHHSGVINVEKRHLSKEEIAEAMEDAKERGLPHGWTVSWDVKSRRKRWISPDGKIAKGIPEAVEIASQQRALTASEVAEKVNQNKKEINNSNPLAMLADVGGLLSAPQEKEMPTKDLSPYEKDQALTKARERGLPEDWTVKRSKWGKKTLWISPTGKVCKSIPEALQVAGVAVPQKYRMSDDEIESVMTKAKEAGLPDDWTVDPYTKRQKFFISPKGEKAKGLRAALEMAGVFSRDKMTPKDVEDTLQMAKERGLVMENGWIFFFDFKRRRKRWVSPEGIISDTPPTTNADTMTKSINDRAQKR